MRLVEMLGLLHLYCREPEKLLTPLMNCQQETAGGCFILAHPVDCAFYILAFMKALIEGMNE